MSMRDENVALSIRNRRLNSGQIRFVFLPPTEGGVSFYLPQLECAGCGVMMLWNKLCWWCCSECDLKVQVESMAPMLDKVEIGLKVLRNDVKRKQGGRGFLWFLARLFGKSRQLPP
jgi:hypothetical protein